MSNYETYRDSHKIRALYRYHPMYFRRLPNPDHYRSAESGLILRLKDLDENAINLLTDRLVKVISQSDNKYGIEVVCSIPSSNHSTHYNGIRLAAMKVARTLGFVDGTGCLIRSKDKPKSHFGARSLESNIMTLDIQHPEIIRGKKVLLLDDVTTSGHSMVSGEHKLYEAGVVDVGKLALGETVYYGRS